MYWESLIPKDQKKYNNTEMKYGRLFTAATQHLTTAVNIKILVRSRSLESNQTKIRMKNADPVLLSLFMRDNEKVQHLSRPLVDTLNAF